MTVRINTGGGIKLAAPPPAAPSAYTPNPVAYASANYLNSGPAFATDSTTGSIIAFFRPGADGVVYNIFSLGTGVPAYKLRAIRNSDNSIIVDMKDATTVIYRIRTANTYTSKGGGGTGNDGWTVMMCSWDCSTPTGQLYLSDSPTTIASDDGGAGITTGGTPDVAGGGYLSSIAAEVDDTDQFVGGLANVFVTTEQIDFSVAGNRNAIINGGVIQDPGTDGSNWSPTSTAPEIFIQNAAATCNVNSGSGANYTIQGTPTDHATPVVIGD